MSFPNLMLRDVVEQRHAIKVRLGFGRVALLSGTYHDLDHAMRDLDLFLLMGKDAFLSSWEVVV